MNKLHYLNFVLSTFMPSCEIQNKIFFCHWFLAKEVKTTYSILIVHFDLTVVLSGLPKRRVESQRVLDSHGGAERGVFADVRRQLSKCRRRHCLPIQYYISR